MMFVDRAAFLVADQLRATLDIEPQRLPLADKIDQGVIIAVQCWRRAEEVAGRGTG